MHEETGATHQDSPWASALAAGPAKMGKTGFLVAGALGQLPWQKHGGIVDKPENLHVITYDRAALDGVKRFLIQTCKARPEALNFKVYNMQDDLLATSNTEGWDYTFLNTVKSTIQTIQQRAKGASMVLVSSLTGMAEGLINGLKDPTGLIIHGKPKKGNGMDQAKWGSFAEQINELRNMIHSGDHHVFWEAHILRKTIGDGDEMQVKDSLQIQGQTADTFPYNVAQVFQVVREYNKPFPNTKCDLTHFNCRPAMSFVSNGRSFNECLEPKEYDPTVALAKLGLTVGGWGAPVQVAAVPSK